MTKHEEKIIRDHVICKYITGSQAYGTNLEGSDTDYVGVYVQPMADILGTNYIPQINVNKDEKYYEIRRFLELAATNNPNILELFNMPQDCVVFETPFFRQTIKPFLKGLLSKKSLETFIGYAKTQMRKAKGHNKKMNMPEDMKRKDVLDFCYVLGEKEESIKFKTFEKQSRTVGNYLYRGNTLTRDSIGLAKVNNMPDLYSMYYMSQHGGIIVENSNDVQLRSIPKDAHLVGYLRFDRNAYSTHCKDYREWAEWKEKRNPLRHRINVESGQNYDPKNIMHCIRLLDMVIDVGMGNGIVVRRPDAEYLKRVRLGDFTFNEVVEVIEQKEATAKELFSKLKMQEEVGKDFVNSFVYMARRNYYKLK